MEQPRDGTQLLLRETTEGVEPVQPREETTERGTPSAPVPVWRGFRGWTGLCWVVPSHRTRAKGQKMINRKFHSDMRKNFFTVG